jgi:hypothetical protein
MKASSTPNTEMEHSTLMPTRPAPKTPVQVPVSVPPVTPPSSTRDECDALIPHDISLPLTPASSICETHRGDCPPLPPPLPPSTSPFSIPWVTCEHGANIDLTPTQPTIDVEKTTMSFSPDMQHYWIRIIDMEPIKVSQKATRLMRDTYVDKIVYLESVKPLEPNEMVHATWTALITWHKTDKMSGVFIGRTPLGMRSIEHRDPPRFGSLLLFGALLLFDIIVNLNQHMPNVIRFCSRLVSRVSVPPSVAVNGLPISLTPTRPTFKFEKTSFHAKWIRIIDMAPIGVSSTITEDDSEKITRTIREKYVGKIVYLEFQEPLQAEGTLHAIWTALIIWHKTDYKSGLGLRIGSIPIDLEAIEIKPLYDRPFTLSEIPDHGVAGANLSLIPTEELVFQRRMVLADGSMSDNVDVVTRSGGVMDVPLSTWMIHKKMTPQTSAEAMVVEANKYVTLRGCKYTPRLLGVTGDPATGDCRGLLIECINGRPLYPIPLMYNNMRLQVTMNLLKAMEEIEERGVYLQDPNPNNIILTVDDGLCIVDFGPGYTEDFYPEDRLDEIYNGEIGIRTAMYLLLMLWRIIWNEGVVGVNRKPVAPTKLRKHCPARLLSMLDDPDAVEYSSFRQLREELQQEEVWA